MFGDTDSPLLITGFFFLFSLFVQFVIIKPTIDRWTKKKKMTKDRFILLWLLLAAASGLNFGLGFGIGFTDMLFNMLKGTIVFGLFHATDLMIYSKLTDKNYGWQQRA
jgi:fatty acid desaturase